MKIYYFVHLTGTDTGISGIPRVVKNLGVALASTASVVLEPVSWSKALEAIIHTEQRLLDNLARYDGPVLTASAEALGVVRPEAGEWLLIPEAPHLGSHDPAYPSLLVDEVIGFARRLGMRVAVILHDIMPLTHRFGPDRRKAFADMVADSDRGDEGERQRLRFAVFAHALARADLVLPVSRTSGDLLADWLIRHGHDANQLPPISPNLLPEEVRPTPRVLPHTPRRAARGRKDFLTVGTVCTHKNQLAAMAAFQRLLDRRPDLDIRLDVVGVVAPDVAVAAGRLAKRSRGRIVLHGHLSDERLEAVRESSWATVFISLAEGYGLPVAESLWRGKPCLCSNEGSIAEIAAGGGCLSVDPRDLDAIEAGFETLATDRGLYEDLLQQIASRELRTWRDYARETTIRLAARAEGRSIGSIRPGVAAHDAADLSAGAHSAMLTISSSDLAVPAVYMSGPERSIRFLGAIRYEREAHGAINEDTLFFGPYVWLPAGAYQFRLDGEITGEIVLNFTAEEGKRRIARVAVTSFEEPIVIDLEQAVDRFEIIGHRTPALERLSLRGAAVAYRAPSHRPLSFRTPPKAEPKGSGGRAIVADPPAAAPEDPPPVYGLDDDGRPLSFPCVIAASIMRVHDAYGAGSGNGLRSGSSIVFQLREHGDVAERTLFFGPYFRLEPGEYAVRFDGELQGRLRVRLTQHFGSQTLVERIVKSFEGPIRLTLTRPVEKFEIVGDRTDDLRSLTLRAIHIARETAEAAQASESAPAAAEA